MFAILQDVMCGRYGAFALANIASNPEFRGDLVDEGAIPPLVALACAENRDAQRQALAALRGIAMSPENRPKIVKEGVLDPLVLMAQTEDVDLLREVAAAMCSFSSVEVH